MDCHVCPWGKTVLDGKSELGNRTIIMCGKPHCTDKKDTAKPKGIHSKSVIQLNDRILLKKPLVYVCSPLRDGNEKDNLANAARFSRFVAKCGAVPITPYLYFTQFFKDSVLEDRRLGIELGLDALANCEQIWVFGTHISTGMRLEINLAKELRVPINFFDSDLKPLPLSLLENMLLHNYQEVQPDPDLE